MTDIGKIDRNLAVVSKVEDSDVIWHDVHDAPFSLHGFCCPQQKDEPFRRIPSDIAEAANPGVYRLHKRTAGGRVRFKTNSPYVAIHVEMTTLSPMPHMAFVGIMGFDMYIKSGAEQLFRGSFRPPIPLPNAYEGKLALPGGECEVTINFPLYNQVDCLLIGLQEGASLSAAAPYTHAKPVVYYGSSITQGGCASRPGTCYPAIISRWLDCDHINLGFSGSCRAEEVMARYIAELDMSVLVYDYDHNAPDDKFLRDTHEPFFRLVREKRPDLPIIFVSRPDVYLHEKMSERCLSVILETYNNALKAGDQYVDFVNGGQMFAGPFRCDCTVDGSHPTDLGFAYMAEHIAPVVKKWL